MEDGPRRLLALLGLAVVFEGYGRALPTVTLAIIGADLGAGSSALSYRARADRRAARSA